MYTPLTPGFLLSFTTPFRYPRTHLDTCPHNTPEPPSSSGGPLVTKGSVGPKSVATRVKGSGVSDRPQMGVAVGPKVRITLRPGS